MSLSSFEKGPHVSDLKENRNWKIQSYVEFKKYRNALTLKPALAQKPNAHKLHWTENWLCMHAFV